MTDEDRIWRQRVIDECARDIEHGLDHSLSNAPGRVHLARVALERLCKAVLRCPDEVLVDLRKKLAEADARKRLAEADVHKRLADALKRAALELLDAMEEQKHFSPLEAYSPAAQAWRVKYDVAKEALRAALNAKANVTDATGTP